MRDLLRIVLVASLAIGACAGQVPSPSQGLHDRTFLSVEAIDGGRNRPLVAGTRIRLDFRRDGTLGASAGCNHIGGSWRAQDGRIRFDGGGMTEMGCDPELHAQDDWLVDFLASEPAITLSGADLTLAAGDTTVRLQDREVAQPDLPLVGPVWTLTTVRTGDTAMSPLDGPRATLEFTADRQVRVSTGCNEGTTTVAETPGGGLRFGPIALTRRACAGGGADLEGSVLAVLSAPEVQWSIDADGLRLDAGNQGLTYAGR